MPTKLSNNNAFHFQDTQPLSNSNLLLLLLHSSQENNNNNIKKVYYLQCPHLSLSIAPHPPLSSKEMKGKK